MSESESKHDKILKRVHLWIAVLGGIVGLLIGLYNFKGILFPPKEPAKPASKISVADEQKNTSLPQASQNVNVKIRQYEWKGSPGDFSLLDLDSNGILNAQDFKGTGFEAMDRNGDGLVEKLEWRKSRRAFDMLDTDGDSKVSRQEFSAHERAAAAFNNNSGQ